MPNPFGIDDDDFQRAWERAKDIPLPAVPEPVVSPSSNFREESFTFDATATPGVTGDVFQVNPITGVAEAPSGPGAIPGVQAGGGDIGQTPPLPPGG